MDWESLKAIGETTTWIGGTLAAIWAAFPITKYAVSKVRSVLHKFFIHPAEVLMRVGGMVETIEKELKPNGGSSLRDAVNRVEGALKTNTEFTKFVLSNMDDGFFEADAAGNCLWVSKKWVEITGLTFSQALNNGWINSVIPQDRQKVKEEWFNALVDKREFNLSYSVNPENPTVIQGVTQFLRDNNNKIVAIVGSIKVVV